MGKELSAAFDAGFGKFVLEHSGDDVSRLVLGRDKWPGVDVDAAVTAIECRKKIRTKLPEWYAVPEIVYPDRICAEQSSSSETAAYKAGVAERIMRESSSGEMRVADLTGGLGVDSLAFSRVASRVLYNEMDSARASAAVHNFRLLGAEGRIEVSSCCVTPDAQEFWDRLKSFAPSLIYADPARRSASGSKVFLLEDCSPDILTILPRIFSIAPNLLLKVSPMADLSMLAARVGEHGASVAEAHVVAAAGECKELLLLVKPSPCGSSRLFVNEGGHLLSVDAGSGCAGADSGYVPVFMDSPEQLMSAAYLFEPGKALSKAGLFNAVCHLFTPTSHPSATHAALSTATTESSTAFSSASAVAPAVPTASDVATPAASDTADSAPAVATTDSDSVLTGFSTSPLLPEHTSESTPFNAADSRSVHPEHSAAPALSEHSAPASSFHSEHVMRSVLSGRVVEARLSSDPVPSAHTSESTPFCAADSCSVHSEHSADPVLSGHSAPAVSDDVAAPAASTAVPTASAAAFDAAPAWSATALSSAAKATVSNSEHVMRSVLSGRVAKAGRSTHLYFTDAEPSADGTMPRMADFGKMFRILEILPLDKRSIKAFSSKYPRAEVSARNIPMSSDELRKKLKVASGGDIHIFGFRADFRTAPSANFRTAPSADYLLAASRL